jgi:Mn-dependent DtxR family transcriptional regulator
MSGEQGHEIELNSLDRDVARTLAERGLMSCTALAREMKVDLRLIDRCVFKLLHNGLITVDEEDLCAVTEKGRQTVPKASPQSFQLRMHRIS